MRNPTEIFLKSHELEKKEMRNSESKLSNLELNHV